MLADPVYKYAPNFNSITAQLLKQNPGTEYYLF